MYWYGYIWLMKLKGDNRYMLDKKIVFIGMGNMSYVIIGGMVKNGFVVKNIIVINCN